MAWAGDQVFKIILGCLIATAIVACEQPDPLSSLAQGETGRVVRIIDGDALVLDTGLTVRLVGLEAPAPERRNRKGQPYAETSARLLEDLAMGRQVRLIYPGITRDRYDRALAYVITEDRLGPDLWLNREMLRRGAARARFYPDTASLGDLLLRDEAEARENERGLWALEAYRILPVREIEQAARGFEIVHGTFDTIAASEGSDDDLLCIRSLVGTELVAGIGRAAASLCDQALVGHVFELRGYIYNGRMDITDMLNAQAYARPGQDAAHTKAH